MLRLLLLVFIFPFSMIVVAKEIPCSGAVGHVMADHPNCTTEGKKQIAFRVGGNTRWLCTTSDAASSTILAAKMSLIPRIDVYIDDTNGEKTCANHDDYLDIKYVIIP